MRRCATVLLIVFAAIALALPACWAPAMPPPRPGTTPEFGISAYFMDVPRYLRDTSLLVKVWGGPQYDSLAVGEARVEIPAGIATVSGDTLRRVLVSDYQQRPPSDRRWVVTLRPEQTGRYQLMGALRIDGGVEHGVDETDFVLSLDVRTDSVRFARAPHPTRFECVRSGQRYRYADGYLVPIDSTEALLEAEITMKPRVLFTVAATAPHESEIPAGGVPLVVMVGKDGRVLGVDVVEQPGVADYDPLLIDAARRSIGRWRFAPALAHGHPVADYLVVHEHFGSAEGR